MRPTYRIHEGVYRFVTRAFTTLRVCALLVSSGIPLVTPIPAQPQGTIQASDAARFLEQATFGPSFATDQSDPNFPVSVAYMQSIGYESWLVEQFGKPVLYPDDPTQASVGTNYASPGDPGSCDDSNNAGGICWSPTNAANTCTNTGPSSCSRDNYTAYQLQGQFYSNALTGVDQLRQRVAWAVSQIFVVSQIDLHLSSWMTPYLQLFDRDAFGDFRQLLYDITVNPAMGEYLNMRGNVKTNVNENYAREILQLFSVGLNLLNPDGTVQVDADGNRIPTYGQDTITDFAKVFTGWNLGGQVAPGILNYRDPMIVTSENNHDTTAKTLLDYPGAVFRDLPGGQDARTELNEALDNIFNHPNVGPFIGKLLIQKLVTSNPSPNYVQNVTSAFNTGTFTGPGGTLFGSGQRGDMQAVIAAILLDPEARTAPTDANSGHLREPVLFITNTLRALGIVAANGSGYTTDFVLGEQFLPAGANTNVRMDQDVFRPPTVFSYYPPDNQLPGSTLLGPEFGILSTSTALAHINFIYDVVYHQMPVDAKNRPSGTWIDTTPFEPEAGGDATALINDLNNRLMHGSLSGSLSGIVLNAVTAIPESDPTGRVREAIYLIASSAEYDVER